MTAPLKDELAFYRQHAEIVPCKHCELPFVRLKNSHKKYCTQACSNNHRQQKHRSKWV